MTNPVVWLSPVFNESQFFDNNGVVLNGGLINAYASGSFSVEQNTYTDHTGATPNSNPIVLDSSGRPTVAIWLDSTLSYNLVLRNAAGSIIKSVDNVTGVFVQVAAGQAPLGWQSVSSAPTYINPTQFLLAGNFVTQFAVGNRVQILNTNSTYQYATVSAVSYSSPDTYVTVVNDSSNLTSGMTGGSAYWSENVTYNEGSTVDAGAVTFTANLAYSNPKTVGGQINATNTALSSNVSTLTSAIEAIIAVWPTTHSGTAYVLTPSPAAASNTVNALWQVAFNASTTSGSSTLNVSGKGAANIKQYTSAGTLQDAVIVAGMVSTVIFDGTYWILQNALPAPPGQTGYWSYCNAAANGGAAYINYQSQNVTPAGISYSSGLVTVSVAGLYFITGTATEVETPGVGGNSQMFIYHNGGTTSINNINSSYANSGVGVGGNYPVSVTGAIYLNAGDTVGIYWNGGSGGRPMLAGSGSFTGFKVA